MYTFASSWSVVTEDSDGTILDLNFWCPNCGYDTGTVNFTSQSDLVAFEIDVACPVCSEDITIVCDDDNRV